MCVCVCSHPPKRKGVTNRIKMTDPQKSIYIYNGAVKVDIQ